MIPNIHMNEKLVLEHRQKLEREAEREGLLAQSKVHHQSGIKFLLSNIGKFFVAHSSNMRQVERIEESFTDGIEDSGREPELQRTGS